LIVNQIEKEKRVKYEVIIPEVEKRLFDKVYGVEWKTSKEARECLWN